MQRVMCAENISVLFVTSILYVIFSTNTSAAEPIM